VAAFYYDYSDMQIRSTVGVGVTRVDNAASAVVQGIEADFDPDLPSGFSFGLHATYLDATYEAFCQPISGGDPQGADPLCAAGIANRSGNRLNQAPEWSGGARIAYETPVGSLGTLNASVTYDFATSIYYVSSANEDIASSGDWGSFGARLGLEFGDGPEVFVFGRNLTDERYLAYSARINAGILYQSFNDPRTYGVGVRYRY
jgi:iron complex outermembrane receptor protein